MSHLSIIYQHKERIVSCQLIRQNMVQVRASHETSPGCCGPSLIIMIKRRAAHSGNEHIHCVAVCVLNNGHEEEGIMMWTIIHLLHQHHHFSITRRASIENVGGRLVGGFFNKVKWSFNSIRAMPPEFSAINYLHHHKTRVIFYFRRRNSHWSIFLWFQ